MLELLWHFWEDRKGKENVSSTDTLYSMGKHLKIEIFSRTFVFEFPASSTESEQSVHSINFTQCLKL